MTDEHDALVRAYEQDKAEILARVAELEAENAKLTSEIVGLETDYEAACNKHNDDEEKIAALERQLRQIEFYRGNALDEMRRWQAACAALFPRS